MCLISVKNKGIALPKKEYLQNGYSNNSDGVGIAVLRENQQRIYIKKDFKDFEDYYKWITENIKENDILITHFRLATSGKIDNGNRHPFPITRNKLLLRRAELFCNFAVAHNGILSDYSNKNKKYSDTQKFIVDILADIKYKLHIKGVSRLVKRYIGEDKLAILDSFNRKLILIGDYIEDEGIYWSNSGYTYNRYTKNKKNDYEEMFCEACNTLKKAKWISRLGMFLCKKCKKKAYKMGLNKWVDYLLKKDKLNDLDEEDEEEVRFLKAEYGTTWREARDYYTEKYGYDRRRTPRRR